MPKTKKATKVTQDQIRDLQFEIMCELATQAYDIEVASLSYRIMADHPGLTDDELKEMVNQVVYLSKSIFKGE